MTVLRFPQRLAAVSLSADELDLLAAAIELDALAHDQQKGSCPSDLSEATGRANELRDRAAQIREAAQ